MTSAAPFPIAAGTGRILLFGGTFDPVHLGHTRAATAARDIAMGADAWLVLVPAARSPFKPDAPGASDGDRLAMLEFAVRALPRTAIWTDELNRPPPSYWVDTARHARAKLGFATDLRFLIGADAAIGFREWRDWRAILDLATPVVMARPPIGSVAEFRIALDAAGWPEADADQWCTYFVAGAVLDISATEVRAALRTADSGASQLLDPAVLDFIRRRGLYR